MVLTISYSKASLGLGDSSSDVSAAPKPTEEAPNDVPYAHAQTAEEMVAPMLRDSPYLDVEEDRQPLEEIPTGEPIVPPPLDLDRMPFA